VNRITFLTRGFCPMTARFIISLSAHTPWEQINKDYGQPMLEAVHELVVERGLKVPLTLTGRETV
jgi:hypothetical protein